MIIIVVVVLHYLLVITKANNRKYINTSVLSGKVRNSLAALHVITKPLPDANPHNK